MNKTNLKKIITIIAKKCSQEICHDQLDFSTKKSEKCFGILPNQSLADFSRNFCSFLEKITGHVQIDLDSFINAMNHLPKEQLLKELVFCTQYVSHLPYCKKTICQKKLPVISFTREIEPKIVEEITNLANSVNYVRQLQDMPSDLLYPASFVEKIQTIVNDVPKIECEVYDKAQLQKMGMNLLLGVNKGSNKEPRLLVMKYFANPKSNEIYGLVGKGITFDSGGMNIKTQSHMSTMKFDMSGAAIVCGTVLALARNKIKTNVIAVAALTENSIGPNALRPDDILISYDGKSVQIDNTDAEGRLVLADAIAYLQKNTKVTRIYDIATLTGAIEICFGDVYTGVWSTSDKIWEDFFKAASTAGELVWRMPFHAEYRKVLDTQIADLSNISNRPYFAGSCVAATFLAQFNGQIPLVHLDIASTAVSRKKTGTGVMVRTLYQVCKNQK